VQYRRVCALAGMSGGSASGSLVRHPSIRREPHTRRTDSARGRRWWRGYLSIVPPIPLQSHVRAWIILELKPLLLPRRAAPPAGSNSLPGSEIMLHRNVLQQSTYH
jgi:hypothetical protein